VYQDAFSADVNKELWTKEYFKDIYNCTNNNCAITTYAISTNIRLSQYESGFEIYEFRSDKTKRKQTLAVKEKLQENENLKYIDMELKQQRNTEARSLSDQE
jgi:tRNA U34 5-methylaminomethyl-2-thiouridine-forming methyltransferase MnmC